MVQRVLPLDERSDIVDGHGVQGPTAALQRISKPETLQASVRVYSDEQDDDVIVSSDGLLGGRSAWTGHGHAQQLDLDAGDVHRSSVRRKG